MPRVAKTLELVYIPLNRHISVLSTGSSEYNCRCPEQTVLQDHEWTLRDSVFHSISQIWTLPQVYLFVTPNNSKCCLFCSRGGYSLSSLGDVLITPWSHALLYAYPLIPLMLMTFLNLCTERTILISPAWPRDGTPVTS